MNSVFDKNEGTDGTGVSVANNAEVLLASIKVGHFSRLAFQFTVADQDLAAFIIKGKTHSDADCPNETLYSDSASFTTPTGLLLATGSTAGDGDLTVVAAGENGSFDLDVTAYQLINVYATSATGTAKVKSFWGLQ